MFINQTKIHTELSIEGALKNAFKTLNTQVKGLLFISQSIDDQVEVIVLDKRSKQYINKVCLSIVGIDNAIEYIEKLINTKNKGSFKYA